MKFQGSVADGKPLVFEQIVLCGVFFLGSLTHYLDFKSFKIFQNIPNNSSVSEEGDTPPSILRITNNVQERQRKILVYH